MYVHYYLGNILRSIPSLAFLKKIHFYRHHVYKHTTSSSVEAGPMAISSHTWSDSPQEGPISLHNVLKAVEYCKKKVREIWQDYISNARIKVH